MVNLPEFTPVPFTVRENTAKYEEVAFGMVYKIVARRLPEVFFVRACDARNKTGKNSEN